MRQRAGVRLAVGLLAVVLLGLATPARAEAPVGLSAGYAFRLADPSLDDRLHGIAAGLGVAGPPVWLGFSGRADGLLLAWPAGDLSPRPLLFAGGAASATYLFDDTATRAVASVGAFGGAVVDGDVVTATFGPIAGLSILLPVVEGVFVEARVAVPFDLAGTLQTVGTATIGVSIAPDLLIQRALQGEGPAAIATDAGLPGFDGAVAE